MPRASTRWFVYIVRCRDGSLYTGCTNDLEARIARHNAGKGARYTRSRLPVKLVFQRKVADRSAALSREARLKQLTREEKLALVKQFTSRRALTTRRRRSPSAR